MSKSPKIRSNLKAADRRRRRRNLAGRGGDPQTAPGDACRGQSDGVDVPQLLIEAVLGVAGREAALNDSAVIGALRAVQNGSTSRSAFTQTVCGEMIHRLDAAGVSETQRRKAAGELLTIALDNTDSQSPHQLIRYLALIAS
ncbi:hypothetical protein Enr13x_63360 [Stieleria neptunia]|uniref:Uncharacterized protein n=1 Tax=Stieleria neptunia TaxID=2527979 RepID=A0A518I082_9BACT|nr:hypothetical protein [Stieleria neptunia]QDV46427.1 hypothetical protein Enr13x_63360 [Stieleria neptunia]